MSKLKKIYSQIVSFINDTKAGHFIKSTVITFTGIYIGILTLNPILNELFNTDFPTIQQLKDAGPVLIDAFYRALWAFVMLKLGIYKYHSSEAENNKSYIIPSKKA